MELEDFNELEDFVNEATQEIAKYKIEVILSPSKLKFDDFKIGNLHWGSVNYGATDEIDDVPDDKRGIYAFVIAREHAQLPTHGYIMYVGIAGRRGSKRDLRARYKDYLNPKIVKKRPNITRLIGTWREVLKFYFAPINDDISSDDLEELERQINTAFLPPLSEGDIEAEVKRKRRAFR